LKSNRLVELNLNIVQILGQHSITVRELKRLFSLLRAEQPGDFRPRHAAALVETLHKMAQRSAAGPARFFVLASAGDMSDASTTSTSSSSAATMLGGGGGGGDQPALSRAHLRLDAGAVLRFPDPRGWSFATWLRLNSLPNDRSLADPVAAGSRLLSFLDTSGGQGRVQGIEVGRFSNQV
jgi:hypothetical protein